MWCVKSANEISALVYKVFFKDEHRFSTQVSKGSLLVETVPTSNKNIS